MARDERGRFTKGNDEGKKFTAASSGGTAAVNGKKGGEKTAENRRSSIDILLGLFEEYKEKEMSQKQMESVSRFLLGAPKPLIQYFKTCENIPEWVRMACEGLTSTDQKIVQETIRMLMDRAYGKPKQTSEVLGDVNVGRVASVSEVAAEIQRMKDECGAK